MNLTCITLSASIAVATSAPQMEGPRFQGGDSVSWLLRSHHFCPAFYQRMKNLCCFGQNMAASRIQIAWIEYLSAPPPSECQNRSKMDFSSAAPQLSPVQWVLCSTKLFSRTVDRWNMGQHSDPRTPPSIGWPGSYLYKWLDPVDTKTD